MKRNSAWTRTAVSKRTSAWVAVTGVVVVWPMVMGGCVSDGDFDSAPGYGPTPPSGYRPPDRYEPRPPSSWEPVVDERDPGSIPRAAEVVARGGGRISYRAERDGTVWVVDRESRRVVVSRRVDEGAVVEVQPGDDRVLINGRKVFDNNMEGKHTHEVRFLAEGRWRDERPARLPRELDGATRVAFGSGGDISHTAREAGTMFVYDASERRIVVSHEVARGAVTTVSPRRDTITVGGKAKPADLRGDHEYELYFARRGRGE
jgi:hypothetical protein